MAEKAHVGIMLRHIDDPGGITVFTKRIVTHLLEHEGDVTFHLLYAGPDQAEGFAEYPHARVAVLSTHSKLRWDQWLVPRYAREAGLDLVFNPKLSVPLLCDVPTAFCLAGAEQFAVPEIFPWLDRLYTHTMMPLFCRKAAAVITHAEIGRRDIARLVGADPTKISVIPHGVDPWLRPADDAERAAVRSRYELPRPYVFFLGGLNPLKNVGNLLRAMAILGEKHDDLELVLAGFRRWRFEEDLRLIEELGLSSRVRQIGYVPDEDLAALYSAAECFALPSWYEGFGIPILEAMACGCPVVTSTRGACPEVAGGAGLTVEPDDPEAVADAIDRLLTDPSRRRACIEAGLRRASGFTWERTGERIREVIRSLLSRPAPIRAAAG